MRPATALLLASTMLASTPAFAQTASLAVPAAAAAVEGEEIIVFGRGETRQVQEIKARDIVVLTPGTNPLKAIEKLPSVNFQSADPFGNYEWSQRVTIRSFNQNQLGFTFDGIPLGDMSYGNHNGLHIARAISSENIGSVRVAQGAGSLGTQATGNLGGTVETFSMDPADSFGAQGNFTYGSNDTMRAFGRINLGSADGIRGYVSYGYGSTDKYKGQGVQDQHMGNAKVIIPIGDAKIDGWLSYSDRREQDYQDMSMGMIRRLGWDWDNTFPDYTRAIDYADRLNDVDLISNSGGSPFPDGRFDYSGANVAPARPIPAMSPAPTMPIMTRLACARTGWARSASPPRSASRPILSSRAIITIIAAWACGARLMWPAPMACRCRCAPPNMTWTVSAHSAASISSSVRKI